MFVFVCALLFSSYTKVTSSFSINEGKEDEGFIRKSPTKQLVVTLSGDQLHIVSPYSINPTHIVVYDAGRNIIYQTFLSLPQGEKICLTLDEDIIERMFSIEIFSGATPLFYITI